MNALRTGDLNGASLYCGSQINIRAAPRHVKPLEIRHLRRQIVEERLFGKNTVDPLEPLFTHLRIPSLPKLAASHAFAQRNESRFTQAESNPHVLRHSNLV